RPRSPSCTTTATRPCSTATSSPATCYSTRGSRPSSPISAMRGLSPAVLPRRSSARRPPAQRGYMAPEIREGVGASVKADVYSFGVLMMETVTGRRPSWPMKNIRGKEVELLKWAREKVEAGISSEIADHRMGLEGEKETKEVKTFLDIAQSCTEESPKYRPTMKEVVERLNRL
uniref:Protein kinase domain-containing protein n=1 Tax=Aegilops tauschii subsp. strangulata TaxID=200361 RepID=A0A453HMA0_AEGTS